MRLARCCVPLLALACGAEQPVGHILVVAEALVSAAQITRVTVTLTPSGSTQDLTANPQDPTRFTGAITVPVGTYTVRAEAFASAILVGSGSVSVTVTKGARLQAQIAVLDSTGPVAGPDHSPVVTSLVVPLSAQVDDTFPVAATALDADGDPLSYLWEAAPAGCGTFAAPAAPSTILTAKTAGACAVTFTATANAKSASRSAQFQIGPALGGIDITVQYVPQPLISSISFRDGSTLVATVARTGPDATIRALFHKGNPYTVTFSFDAWPIGTVSLSDSCGGTIVQPSFAPNATSATATWTPGASSDVTCNVTATVKRDALTDNLFVVVLPVP
jgi:hypothetical protein